MAQADMADAETNYIWCLHTHGGGSGCTFARCDQDSDFLKESEHLLSVSSLSIQPKKSTALWLTAPLFLGEGGCLGEANFNFVICTFAVIFFFFVFKPLGFNEIFRAQGQKGRRTLNSLHRRGVCGGVEGLGVDLAKLFGPAVESRWLTQKDWLENRRWHCWQNIPDRPDSRLISHPFFNVTPGLRTLEDYTQICQQEDHSGTASTWMGTQCTQKNDGAFFFVLPGRSVWESGGFGLEFRKGDQKNSIFFRLFSLFIISFHLFVTGPRHLHASEHCSILP